MATVRRTPATKKATTTPRKRATKSALYIRNTRNCPVHLRLRDTNDQRYFIELTPRGEYGDVHRVPPNLTEDHSLLVSINQGILEVITQTEANNIEYGPQGYAGENGVEITRPDDATMITRQDWDGKGRAPARTPVQPQQAPSMQAVAGADAKMKIVAEERRATAEDMIPGNVDVQSRRVRVERIRN